MSNTSSFHNPSIPQEDNIELLSLYNDEEIIKQKIKNLELFALSLDDFNDQIKEVLYILNRNKSIPLSEKKKYIEKIDRVSIDYWLNSMESSETIESSKTHINENDDEFENDEIIDEYHPIQ